MSCCSDETEENGIGYEDLIKPTKLTHKIVFLGDISVGKTSIISRFLYDTFGNSTATIGVTFAMISLGNGNNKFNCQLWDTAGQEKYNAVIPSYVRNADVVVITFSLVEKSSFENVQKWIKYAMDYTEKCTIIIVGTKEDLTDENGISDEEVTKIYDKYIYIKTSSKNNTGINELFEKITVVLDCKKI